MSATPTPAPSDDPAALGTPGPAPSVTVTGSESDHGVTTDDIVFSHDATETEAYLVRPASQGDGDAHPGIIWFHWLETGAPTSNRTEFLAEAQALAREGVVSLLVQGTFPWKERPASLEHDRAAVEADARMLRAGLDLLAAQPGVDSSRLYAVGHDFGGMYASVVFGTDDRLAGLVMMASTARWADWFYRYWPISDAEDAYLAGMAPLDPVTWLSRANGRPMLLQFAGDDQYVPEEVAAEITAAAGESALRLDYPDAEHELNDAATTDRDTWLREQLGL